MAKGNSRSDRLQAAVNKLREGLSEIEDLKSEYEDWQSNMPENLQQAPVGEKLTETIDTMDTAISGIESEVDNLDGMDLPKGFGRD